MHLQDILFRYVTNVMEEGVLNVKCVTALGKKHAWLVLAQILPTVVCATIHSQLDVNTVSMGKNCVQHATRLAQ